MFEHTEIEAILHALVTGNPDRALRLVHETDTLDEDATQELMGRLSEASTSSEAARRLGDQLRALGADRGLVNECYRAAFYASDEPLALARNPLYAHFLAKKGGLVLDKWPHYFEVYDRYLSGLRGREVRVLEIGVYRGGGLDLLRDYLGPSASLVGIDIDPIAAEVASSRHTVELGDQSDPEFLRRVVDTHGPFDVVIDDGGHTMEQQISTAEILLPLMPDHSTYIVEDTHTSYWSEYGGGVGVPGSFTEWAKGLVDQIHAYHWSSQTPPAPLTDLIGGLHIHDSVVVLDVRHRMPPFSEVVGSWDFLRYSRPLTAIHVELLATRDAALSARDAAAAASAQAQHEAGQARVQASQARAEADRARLSKERAWDQLEAVRDSRSWRVTEPLRRLGRRRSVR